MVNRPDAGSRALTREDPIGVSRTFCSVARPRTTAYAASISRLNDEATTSGAHRVPARRENGVPVMSP